MPKPRTPPPPPPPPTEDEDPVWGSMFGDIFGARRSAPARAPKAEPPAAAPKPRAPTRTRKPAAKPPKLAARQMLGAGPAALPYIGLLHDLLKTAVRA